MIPLRDDNPTARRPVVTWSLVAACVVAFLWELSLGPEAGERVLYALGVIPAVLFGGVKLPSDVALVPPFAAVFTSMFLHGGWLHLGSNVLYLWIFGDNVEEAFGRGRYLAFYLACGVAAALAQSLAQPTSEIPMIGASGAISGVLGAYLLLYPHARVSVVIPIVLYLHFTWLPAYVLLLLWFAMQLFSSAFSDGAGGVAFLAHVGGFVAGVALTLALRPRRRT